MPAKSLPSWECGLKSLLPLNMESEGGHSLLGSVDWNRPVRWCLGFHFVTPFLGVWIEITERSWKWLRRIVTPFLGVWIEIVYCILCGWRYCSHSLLGSVDWNNPRLTRKLMEVRHSLLGSVDWNGIDGKSLGVNVGHSLLGSVDWNFAYAVRSISRVPSLPSWECGLKLPAIPADADWNSHSLLGSVDWNRELRVQREHWKVTPFLGVWIEIMFKGNKGIHCLVTPFLGVWIEIPCDRYWNTDWKTSLPSWECGLKWLLVNHLLTSYRHSLLGSVDWNGKSKNMSRENMVTPFLGVWIEILC